MGLRGFELESQRLSRIIGEAYLVASALSREVRQFPLHFPHDGGEVGGARGNLHGNGISGEDVLASSRKEITPHLVLARPGFLGGVVEQREGGDLALGTGARRRRSYVPHAAADA